MKYGCNGCGYLSAQWLGFCPRCRDDAGLVPFNDSEHNGDGARPVGDIAAAAADHRATGIGEFDRVLGGGLVPGAAVLIAGEPGVGKSTMLLEVAGAIAAGGGSALVASGEESAQQVAARAQRIGAQETALHVMSSGGVGDIVAAAGELKPSVIVVDSVQTALPQSAEALPGSPTAVKLATAELAAWGKENDSSVLFVGHVNKDGAIAGPKVLEHVVDVVTSLEGDHHRDLRVLRCRKNRYGPTNHIGLFRLGATGMEEVVDASATLVGAWRGNVAGSVAFPAVEGGRPVTVEIQALVAPSSFTQHRRSVRGIDSARLHQIIAVLERHGGLSFSGHDIYVGVSGGLRVREPAADLPLALALASSILDRPLGRIGAWGEVGLTGEVRSVAHEDWRREEGKRIGLERFVAPADGDRIAGALVVAGLDRTTAGAVSAA